MSCLPALFCDDQDILLLQEIGREIMGQEKQIGTTTASSGNAQVNMRLSAVKGTFQNRLSGKDCFSVDGVRLVVAILKDSEIIAASVPSDTLECSYPGVSRGLGVSFQANWGHDPAHGVLSLDHSFDDCTVYEVMLALVNTNDISPDDVLLACPCGISLLQISSSRNNSTYHLSLVSLPSPRHYIAFPTFQKQSTTRPGNLTKFANASDNPQANQPKARKSVELSYLSLAESMLSIDVSWKAKELDVDASQADQGNSNATTELNAKFPPKSSDWQLDSSDSPKSDGYIPVRVHRWQEEDKSNEKLQGVTVDESPVSVTVDSLESLASKQYSPLVFNNGHALRTPPPFPESDSEVLDSIARALEKKSGRKARFRESRTSATRNTSDMTQGPPIPEALDSPSCATALKPKPNSCRGWTKAFRKVRFLNTKGGGLDSSASTTASDCSDESAFQELLDSSHSSAVQKYDFKIKRTQDCTESTSKGTDQSVASISLQPGNVAAEEENSILASTVGEETVSMVTIPRALQRPDVWQITDPMCASSLLDSICSWGGHEQIKMEMQESVDEEAVERLTSGIAPERSVCNAASTSSSNACVAPDEISVSPLKAVLPVALSSKISDLTVDVDAKYRRALLRYHGLERFQSLDESVSKKSISDESTTLTLMEDRMLKQAYAACGGDYLDSLTDALFGKAPVVTQDLDDATNFTAEEKKTDFQYADFAYTRTEQDQSGIDHQLTTITEESEAFVTVLDLQRIQAPAEVNPSFSFDDSQTQTDINEIGRSCSF